MLLHYNVFILCLIFADQWVRVVFSGWEVSSSQVQKTQQSKHDAQHITLALDNHKMSKYFLCSFWIVYLFHLKTNFDSWNDLLEKLDPPYSIINYCSNI